MKRLTHAVILLLGLSMVIMASCTKDPNSGGDGGNNGVENYSSGTYNGHDYVDLGLPSGTLWATCNVGANTPEGIGDYYAWGETEPKDYYYWNSYKHCHNGYCYALTKYCSGFWGYNGFTDNLTTLLPEDDAANFNWGSGWRMPTQEEWNELRLQDSEHWKRTTKNGVAGYLYTASNGNCLFLPATGVREADSLLQESGSFCWSSSVCTSAGTQSMKPSAYMEIVFMGLGTGGNADADIPWPRSIGAPVRAVRSR